MSESFNIPMGDTPTYKLYYGAMSPFRVFFHNLLIKNRVWKFWIFSKIYQELGLELTCFSEQVFKIIDKVRGSENFAHKQGQNLSSWVGLPLYPILSWVPPPPLTHPPWLSTAGQALLNMEYTN